MSLLFFVFLFSNPQTVRFKNELERNITIKLGYANAKIYKGERVPQKDDEAKEVIDKDVKAAQDAAKAGAQAAKNVMGGVFGIGGKLVGNAAQKAQKMTGQPAYKPGVGPGAPGAVKPGTMPPGQKPPEGAKPPDQEDKHVKFAEGIKQSEHKPAFVKHINKTRTMSAKQKWDWAFDKILQVGM